MRMKTNLWLGLLAALGTTACCVGPLLLLMLGISGAWISHLAALEPYRPIFIIITLLFLYLAYRQLYLKSQACEEGSCEIASRRRNRRWFWFAVVLSGLLVAFPWYGLHFFA